MTWDLSFWFSSWKSAVFCCTCIFQQTCTRTCSLRLLVMSRQKWLECKRHSFWLCHLKKLYDLCVQSQGSFELIHFVSCDRQKQTADIRGTSQLAVAVPEFLENPGRKTYEGKSWNTVKTHWNSKKKKRLIIHLEVCAWLIILIIYLWSVCIFQRL